MTQVAVLSASDGSSFYEASVSGNTIVATAPGEIDVFVEPAGGWTNMTETAVLTASDNPPVCCYSVAISGGTVIGGAPEEGATGGGYLFVRPPGGWVSTTQTAKLTPSDGTHYFGYSVAISSGTVLIGADLDSTYSLNLGAAYVFVRPAGGWTDANETAKLSYQAAPIYAQMGYSVATNGTTALVGGYQAAALFVEPEGGWVTSTVPTGVLSDSSMYRQPPYGTSVAVDTNWAIVASPGYPSIADVFRQPPTGWTNMIESVQIHSPLNMDRSWFTVSEEQNIFAISDPGANAVNIYTLTR